MAKLDVAIVARSRRPRVSRPALASFARGLHRAGPRHTGNALTIVLAGDAAVRRLNRDFRGKDRTTDVLSFPHGDEPLPDGTRPLGDIVISVAQASRQARVHGHALRHEVRRLVIHGYLHLLGYDHEVADGRMTRLEAKLARALLARPRR